MLVAGCHRYQFNTMQMGEEECGEWAIMTSPSCLFPPMNPPDRNQKKVDTLINIYGKSLTFSEICES